jgi:eukaryotic-like serine/threonine-protein kinase
MTPTEHWDNIEKLIDQALILKKDERVYFLRTECSGNDQLFRDACDYLASIELAEESRFLEDGLQNHLGIITEFTTAAESATSASLLNRQIGHYQLVEMIGEGGMGTVYRANRTDGEFDQQVAFKFLKNGFYSPQMRERFRLEKMILSRLDYPNIARLLDGGMTRDGNPYLVMEYVDGLPVDQYCLINNLSIDNRLKIFKTICDTVQYAHSQLVVHRDLKPGNIYVTDRGDVKILDFGIAKLMDEDPDGLSHLQTQQGQYLLSLQYAAPEQISGGDISTTTDIYVLGILLYQLLTGQFPHDLKNKTLSEAREIVLNQEPVKPAKNINHDIGNISDDLSAIILKALRKDPGERYQSVFELIEDLHRFEIKLPVHAKKGDFRYRSKKFIDRNRYAMSVALALIFITISFVAYHIHTLDEQVKRAELEAEAATAVTDFLVSLFESSDPVENVENEITARDLLVRGTERFGDENMNPDTKIKLLFALGDATTKLGDYEQAEDFFLQADSLSRYHFDGGSYEVAYSIMKMGTYLKERRDYERAEIQLKKALPYFEKNSHQYPLNHASILFNLGSSYQATGRADSSLYFLEKSYEIYMREQPDQSYLYLQNTIAQAYRTLERLEEAEQIYIRIIEEIERKPESDYPTYISALNNLALLYLSKDDFPLAEKYFLETLEVTRLVYGDAHPNTIVIYGNLLSILARQFKVEEINSHENNFLHLNRLVYGEESWRVATAHRTLGNIYFTFGIFDQATNHLRQSFAMFGRVLGPDHNWTANTQIMYSFSLMNANSEEEGVANYNAALQLLEKNIRNFGYYDLEHLKNMIERAENSSKIALGDKLLRVKALISEKS